ncbi:putative kinase [Rhodanobacter sp. ANJX3]|uniref:ATP-binding protein n=1 Tax=unclassified Rhodanobacter TaxID=2621553 RepID=UPI0015CC7F5A|nr:MULTISPECIES: ATP-binding protein [unclassified Rhodanobacter]MBB5357181.1 putative kinase [Rhodanobacter sp. ANJX3]NYE27229.1 putative kinase [Rhodanobacter sp. K2T2]
MHLNPDHYLQTAAGRVFTADRHAAAWERLYTDLSAALLARPRRIIMVIGVQGAGKSTWTRKWAAQSNDAIYVDSTFATANRRARVIEIAKAAGVPIRAVWVKVDLETALRRNKSRAADETVPDEAVENVFRIFEPPTCGEGFCEVVILGDEVDFVQQVGITSTAAKSPIEKT